MKIIQKVKSHFFEPTKCFIPRCKARCCGDAPLPEDFAPKVAGCSCRKVYGAINIGRNDPQDTFNSVVYNTRPLPLIMIGYAKGGEHAYYFDKEMAKKMKMSKEEAKKQLIKFEENGVHNYCPFLNNHGRCQVYSVRPPICREFGTSPTVINHCSRKSSRFDIFKFYAKESSPKKVFLFYKNLVLNIFKKSEKKGA